jgi:hypothetical protein
VWKNLRHVVLVVDMVAYDLPFGRARTGTILPRGDFSTVGRSSDSVRERYTAVRTLNFTPVQQIVLRCTSGSFLSPSGHEVTPHRKREGTRGGYAMDAREHLAPQRLPDIVPVGT